MKCSHEDTIGIGKQERLNSLDESEFTLKNSELKSNNQQPKESKSLMNFMSKNSNTFSHLNTNDNGMKNSNAFNNLNTNDNGMKIFNQYNTYSNNQDSSHLSIDMDDLDLELSCSSITVDDSHDITKLFKEMPTSNQHGHKISMDRDIDLSNTRIPIQNISSLPIRIDVESSKDKYIIKGLEEQVKRLTVEIDKMIAERDGEIKSLEKTYVNQLSKLKNETIESNEKCLKLEQYKAKYLENSKLIEELNIELTNVKAERDDYEKKLNLSRKDTESLKGEIYKMKTDFERIESNKKGEFNKFEVENERRFKKLEEDLQILQSQVSITEHKPILNLIDVYCFIGIYFTKNYLYLQNNSLQNETHEYKHQISLRNNDIDLLENRLNQCDMENVGLRRQLNEIQEVLHNEISHFKNRNAILEADITDLSQENRSLKQQVQSLNADINFSSSRNKNIEYSSDYGTRISHNSLNNRDSTLRQSIEDRDSVRGVSAVNPSSLYDGSTLGLKSHRFEDFREGSEKYNHHIIDRVNQDYTSNFTALANSRRQSTGANVDNYKVNNNINKNAMSGGPTTLASLLVSKGVSVNKSYENQFNNAIDPHADDMTRPINFKIPVNFQQQTLSSAINSVDSSSMPYTSQSASLNQLSGRRQSSSGGGLGVGVPYATDSFNQYISQSFDELERKLTSLMTEKTSLQEESSKLFQRGTKTLKDKNRLNQVENRLEEIGKDIASVRKSLANKPG